MFLLDAAAPVEIGGAVGFGTVLAIGAACLAAVAAVVVLLIRRKKKKEKNEQNTVQGEEER